MKWNKKSTLVLLTIVFMIALSTDVSAQRRHGDRGYRSTYYAYNYRPSRPYISVNIGRPYNYNYRPYAYYGHPVYRPHSYIHYGPSFGVHISILPRGYYPFYIGPNPYYYNDGVYYRPYSGGGYEVIAPPLGATVKKLPSGAKVAVIDGVKYYELGGTYYQEEIDSKNKVSYKVVGTDGVLDTGKDEAITEQAPAENNNTTVQKNSLPEVGARFDKLPEGSKTVILKKEKYYLSPDGVYYQEVIDGNNIRYEVTGTSEN